VEAAAPIVRAVTGEAAEVQVKLGRGLIDVQCPLENAMQFQDNFIVLTENRMVDPVLKVAVWKGRFEMDYSYQSYDVEYDPELRPDRLWQKEPEEEIQRRITFGMPRRKDDLIPFRSKNTASIFGFNIDHEPIGDRDHLILRLRSDGQDFLFMRRLITQKIPSPLSSQPDELIDYVVRSMPKWYGLKEISAYEGSNPRDLKRLTFTFLLDKSFALHLPSYRAHAFEEDGAGNIVFDKREIV
jgi:hypothetical protein